MNKVQYLLVYTEHFFSNSLGKILGARHTTNHLNYWI